MPTTPRRRRTADAGCESYVSLTARASAGGWRVRLGIAQLHPVCAPGRPAYDRLGLSFRATLFREDVPVAEARGRGLTVESLPSVIWRDADACGAFVVAAREWWRDETEPAASAVAHVMRELVWERAVEIGEVRVGTR